VVILAKAPRAGFAKTRLIPALGGAGAAELAHYLLVRTTEMAVAAGVGEVELCVTPATTHPVWSSPAMPSTLPLTDQGDGDLGARMARVARRVTGAGEAVLLIGTDCPELNAEHLQRAAQALQRHDATLIPATDGGYALLGLNRFHATLFESMAWSTETVAATTLDRLAALGWTVTRHAELHDIDEPDDLKWLPKDWRRENRRRQG
jgi:rSAM/selenodomain-associated transferase 1